MINECKCMAVASAAEAEAAVAPAPAPASASVGGGGQDQCAADGDAEAKCQDQPPPSTTFHCTCSKNFYYNKATQSCQKNLCLVPVIVHGGYATHGCEDGACPFMTNGQELEADKIVCDEGFQADATSKEGLKCKCIGNCLPCSTISVCKSSTAPASAPASASAPAEASAAPVEASASAPSSAPASEMY